MIAEEIGELPGRRFALIVDEAHSSQSGESTKGLKSVLAARSLEKPRQSRRKPKHQTKSSTTRSWRRSRSVSTSLTFSTFAFTATPKSKTLELFGDKQLTGRSHPSICTACVRAIEEGFIRDVLESYTTYKIYWRLIKKIEEDPRYDKSKADYLLRSFVDLHPHAIDQKVRVMVDHFVGNAQKRDRRQGEGMIVTRSRLHAVRYRLAVDKYLAEMGNPFKALVAFSGTVQDGGQSYTEYGMNTIPEAQMPRPSRLPENRFLIVANKSRRGSTQPLLHTMYVDKKLGGVNAVQTPFAAEPHASEKRSTMVLDFANESEEIKASFEPYFETTILSEATDPNLLYEKQGLP